jgi:predicted lysophospholipase L1 biosynthesis ABC-type transport system permease subunit
VPFQLDPWERYQGKIVPFYDEWLEEVGRRELGLRIALGADSRKLVGHVLGEALNLVGVGVALGLAGAFALTRFLSAMLFQVAPHDPASMAATVVVTVVVALVAALVPARRASRVDPVGVPALRPAPGPRPRPGLRAGDFGGIVEF